MMAKRCDGGVTGRSNVGIEPTAEGRAIPSDRLQRAYAHANHGDELVSQKKVDEALREYAAAAALAPEIQELPFWQAITLVSVGREAQAVPISQGGAGEGALVGGPDPAAPRRQPVAERPRPHQATGRAQAAVASGIAGRCAETPDYSRTAISAPSLSSASSGTSGGTRQANAAPRARQSRLLTWSARMTPVAAASISFRA